MDSLISAQRRNPFRITYAFISSHTYKTLNIEKVFVFIIYIFRIIYIYYIYIFLYIFRNFLKIILYVYVSYVFCNRDISFHPSRYDVSILIIYAVETITCLPPFYRFINIYVEFLKISDEILQREITANETVSHFVWCWITPLVCSGELEILHRVKVTPSGCRRIFDPLKNGSRKQRAAFLFICIFFI